MFNNLLPQILACNVTIFDFWEMTYAEMLNVLQAEKLKQKQVAINNYMLANLIGISCARILSDTKYPSFDEIYPQFAEKPKERTWQEMKEFMLKYAEAQNKKMRKEK